MHPKAFPEDVAAGFVLAGGQSSRMGTDKALALHGETTLIQVALNTVHAAGVSPRIAGSRSDLAAYGAAIPDTFPETGPMGGIHAGLSASQAEWNLFLPVDLPLMPASLLLCMLHRAAITQAPVTAVQRNGRIEPFPVVLHRAVVPWLAQRLRAGNTACHAAWQSIPAELGAQLDAVAVENLIQCGRCRHPSGLPPFLWFQSANTPADLALLNRHLRHNPQLAANLKS